MKEEMCIRDSLNIIRDVVNKYGQENFYISFSGGKDSTVLHYLVDEALPGNNIPRVFVNTGIEYIDIVKYVKQIAKEDDRIKIINPSRNVKKTLEKDGYPFKSKEFSHVLAIYQRSGMQKTVIRYLNDERSKYKCPNTLRYM